MASKQEGLHQHAFWLYGVIVGLAIREALITVDPHLFTLNTPEPFAYIPEAARFVVFIVLIIRFYIGSAIYFDKAYLQEDADTKYPKKSYALDFLFGFVHFLFFFTLAASIEIHDKPRRVYPVMLLVILSYDCLWFLASRKYDTRKLIQLWAFVNILTVVLVVAVYLACVEFGMARFRAEETAFIPIILISAIDIAEITTHNDLFATWLGRLVER